MACRYVDSIEGVSFGSNGINPGSALKAQRSPLPEVHCMIVGVGQPFRALEIQDRTVAWFRVDVVVQATYSTSARHRCSWWGRTFLQSLALQFVRQPPCVCCVVTPSRHGLEASTVDARCMKLRCPFRLRLTCIHGPCVLRGLDQRFYLSCPIPAPAPTLCAFVVRRLASAKRCRASTVLFARRATGRPR